MWKFEIAMIRHDHLTSRELIWAIHRGEIRFAGNRKLKIYGRLNCKSGKRMKCENRAFFKSETEAIELGFRPCLHCMSVRKKQVERK